MVSCYNQEDYIEECLDSILGQQVDFEFDIIVSDDCSKDTTQQILRDYCRRHPGRIDLILRDENVGAALNYHGVHAAATGDIIFHFDGDDIMEPGKLQAQYDIFSNHDDVNIVFHKATYFSDDRSYCSETLYPGTTNEAFSFFSLSQLARWGTTAVHSSYAYRKSSRRAKIEREFMEWFFAIDSLIPAGRGVYINKSLVMYRCNTSGASYLSSRAGKYKSYNLYFGDIYHYFEQCPELRSDLYSNFLVTFLAMLKSIRMTNFVAVKFLFKNVRFFRIRSFLDAVSVRKLVGPAIRVR
ncbi:poly-beta-1,6 N-acetyl-D-glucosamine synthase [compost metagenome]